MAVTPGKVIRNCKDPSYDYRPVEQFETTDCRY